jgi:hypothetical protein
MKSNHYTDIKNVELSCFDNPDRKLIKKARKLSKLFASLHGVNQELSVRYMNIFMHLLKHKGRKGAVALLKSYRLQLNQLMLKQTVTPIAYAKSDKDGIALILKEFKPLALGTISQQRFLSSLFRLGELITLKPKYDYSTITSGQSPEAKAYTEKFAKEFGTWLKTWKGLKLLPDLGEPSFPLKNATGPNTSKALPYGASVLFLCDLSAVIGQAFWTSICQMLPESYLNILNMLDIPGGKYLHSRIVSLRDKFGKERIIAIGDVVSNWVLSPIEIAFQAALKKMRSSMAYKQGLVPSAIKRLGLELYSIDLTAMTDRFPRLLQYEVIKARYGGTVADQWLDVMTNRTFQSKIGEIRYEVGNPMGFLSSWSVSTFTHHALVEFLAHKLHIHKIYDKYIMLGDDLVLTNFDLYNLYIETMSELGLTISLPKCTVSTQGYAEFAKRLFTPNGEITGFPVDLTLKGLVDPIQFFGLINTLYHRGYGFTDPAVRDLLLSYTNKLVRDTYNYVARLPSNIMNMPLSWVYPSILLVSSEQLSIAYEKLKAKEINEIGNKISKLKDLRTEDGIALIPEYHPMFITLGNQLMSILDHDPDGYEVWEQWIEQDTRILIPVPTPHTKNILKRDKRLACELEVIKILKQDPDITLPERLANYQIHGIFFQGW